MAKEIMRILGIMYYLYFLQYGLSTLFPLTILTFFFPCITVQIPLELLLPCYHSQITWQRSLSCFRFLSCMPLFRYSEAATS